MNCQDWFYVSFVFAILWTCLVGIYTTLDIYNPNWYAEKAVSKRLIPTVGVVCATIQHVYWNFLLSWISGHFILAYLGPFSVSKLHWSLKLLMTYFGSEIWFFHAHLIMHKIPKLYKRHKKHHEFKFPFAFSSIYCSSMEMFLANWPMMFVVPAFTGLNVYEHVVWGILLCIYITANHSGHQLFPKWLIDVDYHDQHHRSRGPKGSNFNFGSSWLDNLYSRI
jgi:sterol desaturase/sphingolipid hydroxylase (fatty acid hydroxylase superfamily)